jgi:3-oxocholest-4-en-26-oyl-CoA dehydrogenase beta subunit
VDFSSSVEQVELSGLAARVLGDLVTPETLGPHGEGGFAPEVWAAMVRAGLVDAGLPGTVGGGGAGLLGQCAVLVEIGRTVAPVPYLATVTMAASAIAEFGTPEQLERWVVPVVRGEKVLAAALPDVGAPSGFTAEPGPGGWRITGAQTAVPSGAFADGFLIPAETADGVAVFLVEEAEVQAQHTIDHADAALVQLTGAPGEPLGSGSGSDLAEWLRLRGTVGLCAIQLGVLESALRRTAAYTKERKQFDHPIAAFQAVRQRLADAYVDVEAVRLTLWQAAWRLSEDLPAAEEVATAKYWAAEAGHRVAHTAVHLHGGVGIDVDHPLHRYFTAAKRLEFALGGATAQLRALGQLLAAEPA